MSSEPSNTCYQQPGACASRKLCRLGAAQRRKHGSTDYLEQACTHLCAAATSLASSTAWARAAAASTSACSASSRSPASFLAKVECRTANLAARCSCSRRSLRYRQRERSTALRLAAVHFVVRGWWRRCQGDWAASLCK
jgi:hypothetical protein